MRMVWVRHGETLWNRENRLQGCSDIALSETGEQQARQLARNLTEQPDYIFVSPLKRTQAFAAPLAARFALTPHVHQDLCEMSFGRWEGLRYEDMDAKMQKQYAAWSIDPVANCPPGGEEAAVFARRVKRFLQKMAGELNETDTVAVVTHGGVIRVAVTLAMQMPAVAAARIKIATASATVLEYYPDNWYLDKLNDTCHLFKQ